MNKQNEALLLALEALKLGDTVFYPQTSIAIAAIEGVLAQQSNEQVEPVAYQNIDLPSQVVSLEDWEDIDRMWHTMYRPLFAHPPVPTAQQESPQRKPLRGEKINARAKAEGANNADFWAGVRFAEAEHCIKE